MSDQWQTIEQAAVTLGLSVRTVNRHITAGKLQSRLYEGRREVFVAATDTAVPSSRSASASTDRASEPVSTSASTAAPNNGQGVSSVAAVANPAVAASPTVITAGSESGIAEPVGVSARSSTATADTAAGDSNARQRVTAEVTSDRPLDFQTMLALTDSIDDKASLAVTAYQTLARSAEGQMRSLRRVAIGAWVTVGVLGVGAVVAVGWATHRLTAAEMTASTVQQVTRERDEVRDELVKVRVEAAELHGRVEVLSQDRADRTRAEQARAEMVNFLNRQGGTTRPSLFPGLLVSPLPTNLPSELPVSPSADSSSGLSKPAGTQPADTQPAGSQSVSSQPATAGTTVSPGNASPDAKPSYSFRSPGSRAASDNNTPTTTEVGGGSAMPAGDAGRFTLPGPATKPMNVQNQQPTYFTHSAELFDPR